MSEVIDDVGVNSLNAGDASSTGQNAQGLELGQHTTVLSFKKNVKVRYKLHPASEWVHATVIGRAGKATGQYRYWFNVKEDESGIESCVDFENTAAWEMNEAAVNLVLIHEYMRGLDDVALSPKRACQMQERLMPAEQTVLRELVGRINWAVQGSRPDMAFEMVELSTKSQGGTVADLNRAMKAICKLKGGDAKVVFPNLGDPVQWKMVVFSDAAHANICSGLGSFGAHAVFLCNCEGSQVLSLVMAGQ